MRAPPASLSQSYAPYDNDRARLERRKLTQGFRDKRCKIDQPVGLGPQNYDAETSIGDVLLVRYPAVGGYECVELVRHRIQQVTIVEVAPAHVLSGTHGMTI